MAGVSDTDRIVQALEKLTELVQESADAQDRLLNEQIFHLDNISSTISRLEGLVRQQEQARYKSLESLVEIAKSLGNLETSIDE